MKEWRIATTEEWTTIMAPHSLGDERIWAYKGTKNSYTCAICGKPLSHQVYIRGYLQKGPFCLEHSPVPVEIREREVEQA